MDNMNYGINQKTWKIAFEANYELCLHGPCRDR